MRNGEPYILICANSQNERLLFDVVGQILKKPNPLPWQALYGNLEGSLIPFT